MIFSIIVKIASYDVIWGRFIHIDWYYSNDYYRDKQKNNMTDTRMKILNILLGHRWTCCGLSSSVIPFLPQLIHKGGAEVLTITALAKTSFTLVGNKLDRVWEISA